MTTGIENRFRIRTEGLRNLTESKAIGNLPMFMGGYRGGYNEWHLKFVNTTTQAKPMIRGLIQEPETTHDDDF